MNSLNGRYRLKSHGVYRPDGTFIPTSSYLHGDLSYGSGGDMSVLILFKKVPEVAKDIYGYVGTYKVTSDKIVEHHFTVATSPKQVNTVETRSYAIQGEELRLGRMFDNGDRFEAVWVKYA